MVSRLSERFSKEISERKLEIISGDILKVTFPSFDVCVANIPYYVPFYEHEIRDRCLLTFFSVLF